MPTETKELKFVIFNLHENGQSGYFQSFETLEGAQTVAMHRTLHTGSVTAIFEVARVGSAMPRTPMWSEDTPAQNGGRT